MTNLNNDKDFYLGSIRISVFDPQTNTEIANLSSAYLEDDTVHLIMEDVARFLNSRETSNDWD